MPIGPIRTGDPPATEKKKRNSILWKLTTPKYQLRKYPAQEKLKELFLAQLQKRIESIWTNELEQICQNVENADEAACEGFLAAIKSHKAPDGLKVPFLQKVQARIESIWSLYHMR